VIPDADFAGELDQLRREYALLSDEDRERVRQGTLKSGMYLLDQFRHMREELAGRGGCLHE
jgi:hypothetical protein